MEGNASARNHLETALRDAERSSNHARVAEILDWLSWVSWIELDRHRFREWGQRMLALPVASRSPSAFRILVRQATALLQIAGPVVATQALDQAENVSENADVDSFTAYLSVKADLAVALGDPETALTYARLSAEIAAKRPNRFLHWLRLVYFGYIAQACGALTESLTIYERASLLASEARLPWEAALTLARSAGVALLSGNCAQSRFFLERSFRLKVGPPWLLVTRAWIGIQLAIATGDRELLIRCCDIALLKAAVRAPDSYTTGPAIAAFQAALRHLGHKRHADNLLRNGLRRLGRRDCSLQLLIAVAEHGESAMVSQAQSVLSMFPEKPRFARAHRLMFEAIRAGREGDGPTRERLAGEARLLFEDDHCEYYAARCLEISGRFSQARHRFVEMGAVGDAERILNRTSRPGRPRRVYETSLQRREIAQLLLEGATARQIAGRFGITERTVKHRISEIYDASGVSNRSEFMSLSTSTLRQGRHDLTH